MSQWFFSQAAWPFHTIHSYDRYPWNCSWKWLSCLINSLQVRAGHDSLAWSILFKSELDMWLLPLSEYETNHYSLAWQGSVKMKLDMTLLPDQFSSSQSWTCDSSHSLNMKLTTTLLSDQDQWRWSWTWLSCLISYLQARAGHVTPATIWIWN